MDIIYVEGNKPGQVPMAGTRAAKTAGDSSVTVDNVPGGVPLLGTWERGCDRPSRMVTVEVAPGDFRKMRPEDLAAGQVAS